MIAVKHQNEYRLCGTSMILNDQTLQFHPFPQNNSINKEIPIRSHLLKPSHLKNGEF